MQEALVQYGKYDVQAIITQATGAFFVDVSHAVQMHDCLKILEAPSLGHLLNMSSREVTNGNGAMPAFGEKLGPDDIEAGLQVQGWT